MKQFYTLIILISSLILNAQNENLKIHYNFQQLNNNNNNGIVADVSGNGYDATIKNNAYIDKMGVYTILNLGVNNGYLDMGESAGNLINSLTSFSVSTYICVNDLADLNANGNFIWSFANSDDIIGQPKGCMFYSAKIDGYKITLTDYRTETGLERSTQMVKKIWKHLVYTQSGTIGNIYIDGSLVTSGNVSILPQQLGNTRYNFLGRSPYSADAYLKGLISDFRIYNKSLSPSEVSVLASEVSNMNVAYVDYQKQPLRYTVENNPLFSHKYTADPAALVYDNTFYIYTGQDTGNGSNYNMPNWLVFSSKDLKNWEEYEVPLKTNDFKWAAGNFSWASQVIERNGKFYWFVSTEHGSIPGKAIGVAVSNSPTGPFIDAKGTALITNNMTTKWTGISWDDIDPTVWVDDDGQAYIFWGNSKCYYAKLKENMIELDSEIMNVSLPNFTEAPWIHKRGDWYYLSYSAWWPEKTVYAMSQNINGPWEYKGILNELAGNSNTNHHAIVEYGDNWYFVYHNGGTRPNGGSYLRSVCMDYLYYNDDNSIKRIQMTTEGVKKVEAITMSIAVNPNKRTQIKVYPNPTDGIIKVEFPDEDLMNYELALFDMKGVKQLSSFLDNTKKSQLDLSHLSKGMYILNCINSDGLICGTSKIIIK